MFERWERCEATVVARHVRSSGADSEPDYEYVLDVRPVGAAPFRATVYDGTFIPTGGFQAPMVGEIIGVRYDPASHAVALDNDDPALVNGYASAHVPTGFGDGVYASGSSDGFIGGRTPDVLATMHTPPGGLSSDPGERLAKLQALREQGFMTDEEYQIQRQRLIDTI